MNPAMSNYPGNLYFEILGNSNTDLHRSKFLYKSSKVETLDLSFSYWRQGLVLSFSNILNF